MAGLGLLVIIAVWFALSIGLANALAKGRAPTVQMIILMIGTPAILFLPVVDEFLGSREFDRLCADSDTLRIHGSIPVGTAFYTPEGEWRLAKKYNLSDGDALSKLVHQADSLVRWESDDTAGMSGLVPVGQRHTRIYNRATGALMAEWTEYAFAGGFLRRNVWPGGQMCRPPLLRKAGNPLYEKLLRFEP
jgi:hypothetical protein